MHHDICFNEGVEKIGNNTILKGRDTPILEYVRLNSMFKMSTDHTSSKTLNNMFPYTNLGSGLRLYRLLPNSTIRLRNRLYVKQ